MQRLIELTNDYMCFCNTTALRKKKVDLREMNDILLQEDRCVGVVTKREVKQIFTDIYKSQLQIVIKMSPDEKKLDDKKQKQL